MSLFWLPFGICSDIRRLSSNFCWDFQNQINWERRLIGLARWEKLCKPKNDGGMGLRDVEGFNKALLAKQGWHIIQNPSSLVSRVLKSKYFPHTSFMGSKVGNNPSFIWRIIWWDKEILNLGLTWGVDDGIDIQFLNIGGFLGQALFGLSLPRLLMLLPGFASSSL